ncbi:MAG TPA: response regulator [Rhodocyclaceae bacterium]|jgi:CheY-like chemotaxis protein|nr:response regulator [Rhodocyclaceae bacterium]
MNACTALVIEDNENNMELITFILEAHGYNTLRAMTGQEGIRLALSGNPDFVLLDIQLPDMDGAEALKAIRAAESGRKMPIIAVTSYAMSGDRERLLAAGCIGYIEKPIDPLLIINQVRGILGGLA